MHSPLLITLKIDFLFYFLYWTNGSLVVVFVAKDDIWIFEGWNKNDKSRTNLGTGNRYRLFGF